MEPEQTSLKIILIDDAQHDLDAQQRTLTGCKLLNEVLPFRTAAGALDFLRNARKTAQDARFLIFLDLIMAPIDGVGFLHKLREEELGSGSVVVMISGLTDVKQLHQGYQLGAHTFLVKPLRVQDVMELLSSLKNSMGVINELAGNRLVWQNSPRRAQQES